MHLEEKLQNVSVVGAVGKMGRGIALVLAQEMAMLKLKKNQHYQLRLIDSNANGFVELRHYLKHHLKKFAESHIISLRDSYKDNTHLVSNHQIIDAFVDEALDLLSFETEVNKVQGSTLIFEAIFENEHAKIELLKRLKHKGEPETLFLTNTSSIPISYLAEKSGLEGKLIGFHFYNPPAVQKLVEIIIPSSVSVEDRTLAHTLIERLKKIGIPSHDVAGFIGNGHFIRELHFASQLIEEWSQEMPQIEAIYLLDTLTQAYLLRPMGIFQLVDYVGIDICHQIATIMEKHLKESLHVPLLKQMIGLGLKGGQGPDGTQKNGFFSYDGMQRKSIYAGKEKKYVNVQEISAKCAAKMGGPFSEQLTWKSLQKDPKRHKKIVDYFYKLFLSETWGAEQAKRFLKHSQKIANGLVERGVANKIEDVTQVLELGFFHLYGVSDISITQKH
ncbi:3-hydroxyacyl-CoA dehydrogenase family protein [Parachlamydia acanthamoebae]|uniref:3-hydroxyacyl-CoA dehydrogenase family protein n=1 Tax=Parachlamydia acanthamoebae TaxID=83552 RepID=UPI0001C172CD|nr:3-hydroxyacyl-CoA dehydrogenase family protein [Parachlamydia acanthamoebae]EFB40492.1 hypothetical protein pah_c200o042 [Parachlamydia acanthamoebae str. Hall's coccus]